MEKPLISIIVPIYNVEKYIHRCIDSILLQSFTNFELLLIDDGSKDDSGLICDEYAQLDRRVSVFHSRNQGVSSARNIGLRNSIGEYIVFVDSDDELENSYIENLCCYKEFDIVVGGYKVADLDNKITNQVFKKSLANNNKELSLLFNEYLGNKILLVPWGKLYKTDIIKGNNILFDEKYKLGEDTLFNFHYYNHVDSMAIINHSGYIFYNYNHSILIHVDNAIALITDLQKEWGILISKHPLLSDGVVNNLFFSFIRSPFYWALHQDNAYQYLRNYFSNSQVKEILSNSDVYDTNLRIGHLLYKLHLLWCCKCFFKLKFFLFR